MVKIMGLYQYVRDVWKNPKQNLGPVWRERLIAWRKEPSTIRIERPTRIDRARALGYKAKPGIFMVRQKVPRGGKKRPKFGRRRSKNMRVKLVLNKSYQQIAEERTNKKFTNCEVLNSYWVAQDGRFYWFEIIVVDKAHPAILKDKNLKWIAEKQHTGRVYRGLTSAGKKSRGLRRKGKGAEKIRPSRAAVYRKRLATQRK